MSLRADDSPDVPRMPGGWGKAFERFFPWLVTAAVAFTSVTGRFQATESQAAQAVAQVSELREELKDMKSEMVDLKLALGDLTAAVRYSAKADADEPAARPRRPARQFDH